MSLSVSRKEFAQVGTQFVQSLLSPIELVVAKSTTSFADLWTTYLWLLDVEEERDRLRAELKHAQAANSRLLEHARENERLRELLNFSEVTGYKGIAASVIGRSPSPWVNAVTIDRGARHGVRPGLAVVDGKAVVGQTTSVTAETSRVLLITDASSAVDALLQTSRLSGIAEGGLGRTAVKLQYVDIRDEVVVTSGDRVITSGLDGIFPKGIMLGYIKQVSSDSGSLFHEISVGPSADFSRLENVMVILPEKTRTVIVPNDPESSEEQQ